MAVLLNMADEARQKGIHIHADRLSRMLGIPVHSVSARTGEGLSDPKALIDDRRISNISVPDTAAELFRRAREIAAAVVTNPTQTKRHGADRLLIHPLWGLPLFSFVLGLVFLLNFAWVGLWLSQGVETLLELLKKSLSGTFLDRSMITEGLLGSAEYVLSFLPIISLLSLLLTLLEDVGYLPRAAFLLDGWLRWIGLDGRCAVPLLLGFGCTVPAAMATRSLPETRLRRSTVRLLPFVPCSAKLPFVLILGSMLFSARPARGALLFYVLSILLGVVYGAIIRKETVKSGFYLELPPLRLPRLQSVLKETERHVDHFLRRAGFILMPMAFLLWLVVHVNINLQPVQAGEDSLLSVMGRQLLPVLRTMGLDDWRTGVILLSGVGAKETMASTAAMFLRDGMSLTGEQALILGVTALLLPPCLGALTTARGEISRRETLKLILFGLLLAWVTGVLLHGLLQIVSLLLHK